MISMLQSGQTFQSLVTRLRLFELFFDDVLVRMIVGYTKL